MSDDAPVRRPILGILSIVLLFILYRVFAVYTVRSGECTPKPVDPSLFGVGPGSTPERPPSPTATSDPELSAAIVL